MSSTYDVQTRVRITWCIYIFLPPLSPGTNLQFYPMVFKIRDEIALLHLYSFSAQYNYCLQFYINGNVVEKKIIIH